MFIPHSLTRRQSMAAAGSAALLLTSVGLGAAPAPAHGAYPSRPVTLVTDAPPGGPLDILARLIASVLDTTLGQRFVVEKRPLEAIHFAEMALARTPDHVEALRAYRVAHEALLAAAPTRNRWYQYWLNGEITQARDRISAATGGTS